MNPPRNLLHPRDEILQTMDRIYRYRLTTTSGGNISIRDAAGDTWITPARVDKGNLTRADIVCLRQDGTIDGQHPPSSELPFHQAIYAARTDIRAIVHAHPVALVAFSICQRTPDTRLFHQAHWVCGKTGFAPYACPGSQQLGERIATTFQQGCDSVILENHGVVVGGDTLSRAFERFEAFEFAGKTIIKANQLGPIRSLDDAQLAQAANRNVDFKSFTPPIATSEERELRRQLGDFVRRGCRQRLLISTEGSFSVRLPSGVSRASGLPGDGLPDDGLPDDGLSAEAFLITPSQQDRERLRIGDFVLVDGPRREAGKLASRAAAAHQAIYRRHPGIQAIVFAHPVNATAFSVTDSTLDVRTIPESYVFLRDVGRVPYGTHYRDDGAIADYVSAATPAAILENDGVIVTGRSVLDAFDRLEVLESTAEAVINARSIGPISTMSNAIIDELKKNFGL